MIMEIIDSHCHLDFSQFNKDRDEAIVRALEADIVEIVNSGIDTNSNKAAIQLSKQYDFIQPSLGLAPSRALTMSEEGLASAIAFVEENLNEAVAIGEVGLDYHHFKKETDRAKQQDVFAQVIEVARTSSLPLVIHGRDAEEVCLDMAKDCDVIMHCYSGSMETMMKAVDMGCYISIATLVCFSKHHQELASKIPMENLLIETDSPYLSPRKGRNEPAYLIDSVKTIAKIRQMDATEVAKITTRNARLVFGH